MVTHLFLVQAFKVRALVGQQKKSFSEMRSFFCFRKFRLNSDFTYSFVANYLLMNLLVGALLVFLFNLPFGYWRGSVRKFSWQWFVSIHAPVPFAIALRYLFELGFELYTYPVMVGAFFSGQLLGRLFYKKRKLQAV